VIMVWRYLRKLEKGVVVLDGRCGNGVLLDSRCDIGVVVLDGKCDSGVVLYGR